MIYRSYSLIIFYEPGRGSGRRVIGIAGFLASPSVSGLSCFFWAWREESDWDCGLSRIFISLLVQLLLGFSGALGIPGTPFAFSFLDSAEAPGAGGRGEGFGRLMDCRWASDTNFCGSPPQLNHKEPSSFAPRRLQAQGPQRKRGLQIK